MLGWVYSVAGDRTSPVRHDVGICLKYAIALRIRRMDLARELVSCYSIVVWPCAQVPLISVSQPQTTQRPHVTTSGLR
jgi:hypothetical protein